MKFNALVGAAALSLVCTGAFAQSVFSSDSDFIMKASGGNTFEVQSSELALKSSQNAQIKQFARQMIKDHTMAEKKLMASAKQAGEMSPKMELDPAHLSVMDSMKGKTGKDFDAAYITAQVKAHDDTVGLLADYNLTGKTPALKMWSEKTLPTVRMHQKEITQMQAKMGSM